MMKCIFAFFSVLILNTFNSNSVLAIGDKTTFFSPQSQDTTKSVSGKVTTTAGVPLPGVNIVLKGTRTTTVSNISGAYKITVPSSGGILVFSFVGFATKEIPITNALVYNVTLSENSNSLNDVVIIGYGTAVRKDLTGAVSAVKVEDLQKAPVASFEDALAGRVAGLQVSSNDGQPGASSTIVIRGNNSVTQNNSPLYVVDGFPLENPDNNFLNPAEIESIEVLKDASATAIYGSRGANGVIVITTKSGKVGAPVISYQARYGTQENIKQIEVLNPYEFVKYQIEYNPDTFRPVYEKNGRTVESYRDIAGVNWQDQLFELAPFNSHFLSLSGGTDKTKYSISASALQQDGIIINSGFDRYQGRVKIDQTISPKLKTGVNLNYTYTKTYGIIASEASEGNTTNSLMYSAWSYRPVTGELTDDLLGEFRDDSDLINPLTDGRVNPVINSQNTYNPLFGNNMVANVFAEYQILKDLKFRTTGGITANLLKREIFNNTFTRAGNISTVAGQTGVNGSINFSKSVNFLNENTLSYRKVINRNHIIDVVGGYTIQKQSLSNSGFAANQIPNESLGIEGLDEGVATALFSGSSVSTLSSFLARANYNYKSRYILTTSFRADGSSKFPTGNKWGNFASGSLAWRISGEKFMAKIPFISDAKLRAGYGITGNNRVSDFAYLTQLGINPSSGYNFNNNPQQGVIPINLGNDDLKWESTGMFNIGLDLSFFKNRISLTTDYYKKKTFDLLLNATLAGSTGYATAFKNIGKVSNEGIEFTLSSRNIETKKFTWTSDFNISFNRNKLLQLNEGEPNLRSRVNLFADVPYIALPNRPIALFYGYVFDGIYQYSDFNRTPAGGYELKDNVPNNGSARNVINPGFVKYKDINGDGAVNELDQTIIGNPNPIHIGGFSNNFTYAGFDLNVFFQWSYGNDVLNANRIVFEGQVIRPSQNLFATVANRWTPQNQTNELFVIRGGGLPAYSSRVIEDGSFLRLKTVSLGYNLPGSILSKIKIKSLRVYASAQNLYTWTNYSGLDPEVSVAKALPALTPGFDYSPYPRARNITFGLNLSL